MRLVMSNPLLRTLVLGLVGSAVVFASACGGDKKKPPVADDAATDASEDASTNYDGSGGKIPDAGQIAECEEGGNTFFYVLNVLDLGTNALVRKTDPDAPNNVVPGLNLDATDNTEDFQDPPGKCAKRQDYLYPNAENPTHKGIDNRMSNFIEDVGEAGLLPGDISELIQENVNSGKLLLLVRVANVDTDIDNPGNTDYFPADDACVNVDIVLGAVPPNTTLEVGEDGFLLPGQPFDTQLQSIEDGVPIVRLLGAKIQDGVLRGRAGTKLPIDLPTGDEEAEDIRVFIENNSAEFKINATTISEGLLGGTLNVDETAQAVADYTGYDKNAIVKPLISKHSDINPNQSGSACSDISIGLVYRGVTAVDTGMTQAGGD